MKPFSDSQISALSVWLDSRQDFVFLESSRLSPEDHRSLLFIDPLRWLVCSAAEQADDFIAEASGLQRQGLYLAGWIGYEFGYLLEPSLTGRCSGCPGPFAVLGVFEKPIVFDHRRDSAGELDDLLNGPGSEPDRSFSVNNIRTNMDKHAYLMAIDRIKEYIVAGDTYQVNYTLKLQFDLLGSQAAFYTSLRRNQSVSYGAWIRQGGKDIMSFSPELFFRASHGRVTVKPMKGTMARGKTLAEDIISREALHNDLKNRSENVMIVDLLRNDLGHLLHETGGGKVMPRSLFDVEVYDTILQMTSTVDGIPSSDKTVGFQDILHALFPCGSVTGAPKIRTMEIIHELEEEMRGVYCGAIGFSSFDESVFNVPIRTVVLEKGQGEMGVGSGIVFDSEPEAEWSESLLKGSFLTRPRPDFQLIETLLWLPDTGYWLLDEHTKRLAGSAQYFLFHCDLDTVLEQLLSVAESFTCAMRVRLLLYRDGRVGISTAKHGIEGQPDLLEPVEKEPLPVVVFSTKQIDPANVYLYHKTTERQLYTDEREKALRRGFYEVLFTNRDGEVTEGSVTNIFIREKGYLVTPPICSGLLAGTFRSLLLARGLAVENVVARKDVLAAEAVYVGNSVRGLVRVKVREGEHGPDRA